MSKNVSTQTIKVNFQTDASGLQKAYDILKSIASTDGLKVTKEAQELEKIIGARLPAFLKHLENLSGGPLSVDQIKQINKEYEGLTKQLGKLADALVVSNVSEAITAEVEKARKELDAQTKELRKAQQRQRNWGKKLNGDNLSITEQEKTEAKTLKGLKVTSGEQTFNPKTLAELEEIQKELNEAGQSVDNFDEIVQKVTEAIQTRLGEVKENKKVADADVEKFKQSKESAQTNLNTVVADATSKTPAAQVDVIEKTAEAHNILTESLDKQAEKTVQANDAYQEQIQIEKVLDNQTKNSTIPNLDIATKKTKELDKTTKNTNTTFKKAATQVFTYGTAVGMLRKVYSIVKKSITEMDRALTDMAVVTSMSRKETWQLVGEFQNLAKETGKTTTQIADMATKFYQQGKSTSEVMKLTEAAAKAATIAGIDGSRSIDLLTNAMNGFQISASKAMEVSDKFAALAASAATDYEELAVALSKVAAQANLAGMSMDFTLGLLTKGIETTREAPETIGTALKTVISRMRELTDYEKTLEDGMNVNRVESALANIGVALRDSNGQFRDLESVLTEVGKKWDTLNTNQQANVAVALAGTRQQSRLIAMMQDFDRTLELVDISANSYGATMAQSADYMEGLGAATTRMQTALEGLTTSITDSDVFIGIINGITNAIEFISNNLWLLIPVIATLAMHGLSHLSTIILQREEEEKKVLLAKEAEIVQLRETAEKAKGLIATKKQNQETLKTYKTTVNNLKKQKETNKAVLQNCIYSAEARGDKEAVAKYTEKLKQTEQELLQIGEEEQKVDDAILKTNQEIEELEEKERNATEAANKAEMAFNEDKIAQTSWLVGLFAQITNFKKIEKIIDAASLVIEKLKTKEAFKQWLAEKKKNNEKKKGIKAALTNALITMAESAANIPVYGWIIAAAILAVVGLAIAATAIGMKKLQNNTEDTAENLNKLNAELYNINTSRENIRKLGDEFESLSSKVIKTTEDLERMKEIAQSINDEMGFDYISDADSEQTILNKIAGAETAKTVEAKVKTAEINDTLGEGYRNIETNANWAKVGATTLAVVGGGIGSFTGTGIINPLSLVAGSALEMAYSDINAKMRKEQEEYMKALETNPAFVNSIRTVGMQTIEGLSELSTTAQDAVLKMLVDSVGGENGIAGVFTEDGINTDAFVNALGGESGFSAFTDRLEQTITEGTFTAYAEMYESLANSSTEAAKTQLALLTSSMPMFEAIQEIGASNIKMLDSMGLSAEEVNLVMKQIEKTDGKASEKLASVVNNLNLVEGGAESVEARRELFREMVAIEQEAATKSQEILAMTEEERRKSNDADVQAYQNALDQKAKLEAEYAKIEASDDKDKEEKAQKWLDKNGETLGEYTTTIETVQKQATNAKQNIEELKVLLGSVSTSQIVEELTKLGSVMERVGKATDLTNLSLKDQIDLLSEYPTLLSTLERGYMTAGESLSFYNEQLNKQLDDAKASQGNLSLAYEEDAVGKNFTQFFDESGDALRDALISAGTLDRDDAIVSQVYDAMIAAETERLSKMDLTEEQKAAKLAEITTSKALEYAQALQADVQEYNKYGLLIENIERDGIVSVMTESAKKAWNAATDQAQTWKWRADQHKKELERMQEDSDEYNAKVLEYSDALLNSIKSDNELLAKYQQQFNEMSQLNNDEVAAALEEHGIQWEDVIERVGDKVIPNMELLNKLPKEAQDAIKGQIEGLNSIAEAMEEVNDQMYDSIKVAVEFYIAQFTKVKNAEIEMLEQRKEAYEKYFDELDQAREETERSQTMEDLTKQLATLAGGSDSATNAQRKELLAQMEELRKSEEEARRQAIRDAAVGSIEERTEELNKQVEEIENSLNTIISLLASGAGYTMKLENGELVIRDANGEIYKPYATGGLVDYTGPAYVHGTPTRPEAFLSATDTENMARLFDALEYMMSTQVNVAPGESAINNNSNVTVEQLIIQTNELNNEQDFRSAGNAFAEEFAKAIRIRGLNPNVKR